MVQDRPAAGAVVAVREEDIDHGSDIDHSIVQDKFSGPAVGIYLYCMSLITNPSSNKSRNSGKSGTDLISSVEKLPINKWVHPAAFLLDNLADAVISFDIDFNIRSWNKKAEEIYGGREIDVIGRPVNEVLFHEFLTDSREGAWKKLKKNRNGKENWSMSIRMERSSTWRSIQPV